MIIRRLLPILLPAAAFSTGVAVTVVALAFTLYVSLEPRLGRAGAAASVAASAVALMVLAGFALSMLERHRRIDTASLSAALFEQVVAFVREKPIVAASAAVGAGLMAVRNPKYLGEVLRAFLDRKPARR